MSKENIGAALVYAAYYATLTVMFIGIITLNLTYTT